MAEVFYQRGARPDHSFIARTPADVPAWLEARQLDIEASVSRSERNKLEYHIMEHLGKGVVMIEAWVDDNRARIIENYDQTVT